MKLLAAFIAAMLLCINVGALVVAAECAVPGKSCTKEQKQKGIRRCECNGGHLVCLFC